MAKTPQLSANLAKSFSQEQDAVARRFDSADQVMATREPTELIRVGFRCPADEHETVAHIQQRLLKEGCAVTQTDVWRIVLGVASRESNKTLADEWYRLPKVKTGRRPGNQTNGYNR